MNLMIFFLIQHEIFSSSQIKMLLKQICLACCLFSFSVFSASPDIESGWRIAVTPENVPREDDPVTMDETSPLIPSRITNSPDYGSLIRNGTENLNDPERVYYRRKAILILLIDVSILIFLGVGYLSTRH